MRFWLQTMMNGFKRMPPVISDIASACSRLFHCPGLESKTTLQQMSGVDEQATS